MIVVMQSLSLYVRLVLMLIVLPRSSLAQDFPRSSLLPRSSLPPQHLLRLRGPVLLSLVAQ